MEEIEAPEIVEASAFFLGVPFFSAFYFLVKRHHFMLKRRQQRCFAIISPLVQQAGLRLCPLALLLEAKTQNNTILPHC